MPAQLDIRNICVRMATLRNDDELSNLLSGIARKISFHHNANESTEDSDMELEYILRMMEQKPFIQWDKHLEGRSSDELIPEGYDL